LKKVKKKEKDISAATKVGQKQTLAEKLGTMGTKLALKIAETKGKVEEAATKKVEEHNKQKRAAAAATIEEDRPEAALEEAEPVEPEIKEDPAEVEQ
jgi:hypothetical protein